MHGQSFGRRPGLRLPGIPLCVPTRPYPLVGRRPASAGSYPTCSADTARPPRTRHWKSAPANSSAARPSSPRRRSGGRSRPVLASSRLATKLPPRFSPSSPSPAMSASAGGNAPFDPCAKRMSRKIDCKVSRRLAMRQRRFIDAPHSPNRIIGRRLRPHRQIDRRFTGRTTVAMIEANELSRPP